MPKPKSGESQDDFLDRCIPMVIEEEGEERDVAVAKCSGIWEQANKNNSIRDYLNDFWDEDGKIIIK